MADRDRDGYRERADLDRNSLDDRLSGHRSRKRSRSPDSCRENPRHRSPVRSSHHRDNEGRLNRHERHGHRRGPNGESERHEDTRESSHRHHRHEKSSRHKPQDQPSGSSSRRHEGNRHRRLSSHSNEGPTHERIKLPFGARLLSRHDLDAFRPLFGYYLDIQKQKDLSVMDEREARGRWKSFIGKWNKAELAEGWYDPERFINVQESASEQVYDRSLEAHQSKDESTCHSHRAEHPRDDVHEHADSTAEEDGDEADDEIGPLLPSAWRANEDGTRRSGPAVPSLQDLSLRREMLAEDAEEERRMRNSALRLERKADRKEQKERLEELVPRSEPGTRERKLEKRQEVNAKMREFRDRSPGAMDAADDKDLMGDAGDSLADLKRQHVMEERKKSEREVRREEIARAKREEREERKREYREREEGTIAMLKELAKQRFG
jgi:hypothetical protein